jgi:hypothetical protein
MHCPARFVIASGQQPYGGLPLFGGETRDQTGCGDLGSVGEAVAGLRGRSVVPAVGGLVLGCVMVTIIIAAGVGALIASTPAILIGLSIVGGTAPQRTETRAWCM